MHISCAEVMRMQEEADRINWSERRWDEIVDTLAGKKPDIWLINPNWAVVPKGEKCLVWDDFLAWARDRHDDAVEVLGNALRSPISRDALFNAYAEERSQIEVDALSSDYFED